ncbi:uncharacterized protein LOC123551140 [Mercenaria mercenaria]|uniref:uncharacterized protein LOC123551140 n=1 Tax=Mercenaria mercenaria TaxID=6596 RepID=UPI00234F1685|nr:uncharacterized protein LOC123551140 [Mercenaria mercenaria]
MATRPIDGWSYNTLHRTTVVAQRTYERARSRNVEWPKQKPPCMPVQDVEEPFVYTSLDEAFSTILQFMSQTTKQCKKYYKSNPPSNTQEVEQRHCNRFHASRNTTQCRKPMTSSVHRQTDQHVSRPEYIPSQYT